MEIKVPLVSVIIPTYQKFIFLEEAIHSVYIQDYQNIEIILADDGSENFDINMINNIFSRKTENIKRTKLIHHERNNGTVKNLNNAYKEATGEYFIGLSSDDRFYNISTIRKVVDHFLSTNALIVTSKRMVDNELREILPKQEDIDILRTNSFSLYNRLSISNFISGACTFYHRSIFDQYGYYGEKYRLIEDYPYYLSLIRKNVQIHFFDEITILYRLGGVTSSKSKNILLQEDALNIIGDILKYPKMLQKKVYRFKKYQFQFEQSNKKLNLKILFLYPDIIIKKIKLRFQNTFSKVGKARENGIFKKV